MPPKLRHDPSVFLRDDETARFFRILHLSTRKPVKPVCSRFFRLTYHQNDFIQNGGHVDRTVHAGDQGRHIQLIRSLCSDRSAAYIPVHHWSHSLVFKEGVGQGMKGKFFCKKKNPQQTSVVAGLSYREYTHLFNIKTQGLEKSKQKFETRRELLREAWCGGRER